MHGLLIAAVGARRVIATQASVPLVYVPLEAVASKWYGESEKLLADVFRASDSLGGAIIFFDEIDSLATARCVRAQKLKLSEFWLFARAAANVIRCCDAQGEGAATARACRPAFPLVFTGYRCSHPRRDEACVRFPATGAAACSRSPGPFRRA